MSHKFNHETGEMEHLVTSLCENVHGANDLKVDKVVIENVTISINGDVDLDHVERLLNLAGALVDKAKGGAGLVQNIINSIQGICLPQGAGGEKGGE